MERSEHYNFYLPSSSTDDIADIDQLSENFEQIDAELASNYELINDVAEQAVTDQTYDSTSSHAQSGTAVAEAVEPKQSKTDNGLVTSSKTIVGAINELHYKLHYKINIDNNNWDDIQEVVRNGLGADLIPVGYEFTTFNSDINTNIIWVVRGHNHHAAANSNLTYTMTLETKYIYGTSANTYKKLVFDAPEALYYCSEALAAGTYNFTWNYSAISVASGTFQFTLTEGVPAGGQIVIGTNTTSSALTSCKIKTYASVGATTAIESNVAITEGSGGTSLGTLDASISSNDNLNCGQRILFGSNNYAQSGARQWLNSSANLGSVWTPTNKFDRAPSWHTGSDSAYIGFMHGLGDDFLGAVQPAKIACRTNSKFEVDSLDGTEFAVNQVYELNDKFFILSRPEIYGSWDSTSYKDGTQLEYYEGLTNTERVKRDSGGFANIAWLRSPYPEAAGTERILNINGGLDNYYVYYAHGISAACIIA